LTRGERRSSIAGPAGTLEVAFNVPERAPRGIALIAHPHPLQGGTLDNKVVQTLAATFAALGYAQYDSIFEALGLARDTRRRKYRRKRTTPWRRSRPQSSEFGELPVALAGFSFGSYVQSRVAQRLPPELPALRSGLAALPSIEPSPPDTIVIHGEEDDVVALPMARRRRPQQLPMPFFPGAALPWPAAAVATRDHRHVERMSAADAVVLSVVGLRKSTATTRWCAASILRIGRGECAGLLGPNGAGKDDDLALLFGLTDPNAYCCSRRAGAPAAR
jgi:alpha/beta superfamily hydrolase